MRQHLPALAFGETLNEMFQSLSELCSLGATTSHLHALENDTAPKEICTPRRAVFIFLE